MMLGFNLGSRETCAEHRARGQFSGSGVWKRTKTPMPSNGECITLCIGQAGVDFFCFWGGATFSGWVVWIPGILLWKGLSWKDNRIPNHQPTPVSNDLLILLKFLLSMIEFIEIFVGDVELELLCWTHTNRIFLTFDIFIPECQENQILIRGWSQHLPDLHNSRKLT